MAKFFMRLFTGLHAKLVRITGKLGGGEVDGSLLVLTHTGAKSGKVRETPLVFANTDGGYVVVASMGGAPTNPGWYHNLKANPETSVVVSRREVSVRAREVTDDERAALWARFRAMDPRWEGYQIKTDRILPIMALDTQ